MNALNYKKFTNRQSEERGKFQVALLVIVLCIIWSGLTNIL